MNNSSSYTFTFNHLITYITEIGHIIPHSVYPDSTYPGVQQPLTITNIPKHYIDPFVTIERIEINDMDALLPYDPFKVH